MIQTIHIIIFCQKFVFSFQSLTCFFFPFLYGLKVENIMQIHCVKMSVFGAILVRKFPAFSRIRTEYGEIRSVRIRSHYGPHFSRIFPHLDWIRRDIPYLSVFSPNAGKCGKMWTRTTPNTDTFYLVIRSLSVLYSLRLYFQFFKEPHHTQGRSFLLNCIG